MVPFSRVRRITVVHSVYGAARSWCDCFCSLFGCDVWSDDIVYFKGVHVAHDGLSFRWAGVSVELACVYIKGSMGSSLGIYCSLMSTDSGFDLYCDHS